VRTKVLIVLSVLIMSAAALAADAPIRLALLTGDGDRAVDEATLAQVEVTLTETKEVTLLERAQIKKILAEQKLSAAGLIDPATAVRLGRLLPVDIFLLTERIPKTRPAACRAQCIEAQTGIILASDLLEETRLTGDASELKGMIAAAAQKQRIPPETRQYIGIVGIRNEEPGRTLDAAVATMEMLLPIDLQKATQVVVVDREHLDLLLREEALTSVWLKLKGSTAMVEAGLQRTPDGKSFAVSLRLTPASGGEPQRLTVTAPMDDASVWRRAVADAVLSALKQKPPELKATDPEREAKLFDRQSTFAADDGGFSRAREAALAISPTESRRRSAANAYRAVAASGFNRYRQLSDEQKTSCLKAAIRSAELSRDLWHAELQRIERGENGTLWSSWDSEPSAGHAIPPGEGEIARLQEELAASTEENFQLRLKCILRKWDREPAGDCALVYYRVWQIGYGGETCDTYDVARRLKVLSRIADAIAADPPHPLKPADEYKRYHYLTRAVFQSSFFQPSAQSNAQRAEVVHLLEKWRDHPNPFLRLIACVALLKEKADAKVYTARFLDEFEKNFPDGCPCRTNEADEKFFLPMAVDVVDNLVFNSPDQANADQKLIAETCRRLVSPSIARKNLEQVRRWGIKEWGMDYDQHNIILTWFLALARLKRFSDEDELIASLLSVYRPDGKTISYPDEVQSLEKRRKLLAPKLEGGRAAPAKEQAAGGDKGWEDYEVLEVPLPGIPQTGYDEPGPKLIHKDMLYTVVGSWQAGKPSLRMLAYSLPNGGAPALDELLAIGNGDVSGGGMTASDDTLYVSTGMGIGVFPLNGDKPWLLDESRGLPAFGVRSVEWLDGKLYMFFGNGFGCYDLATRTCRLIVAPRSLEKRPDIPDPAMWVQEASCIYTDRNRKCLWIPAKSALWQYNPLADRFDAVKTDPEWRTLGLLGGIVWQGRNFLVYRYGASVCRLDLDTMKLSHVMGRLGPGETSLYPSGAFSTFYNGAVTWPVLMDGENLIATGNSLAVFTRGGNPKDAVPLPFDPSKRVEVSDDQKLIDTGGLLILLRPNKEPVARKVPFHVRTLYETPFGILAPCGEKAYLIKHKAAQ